MSQSKFNLEERTIVFAEKLIVFLKGLSPSVINQPIISQLIRSSTSIGANYHEANNASSKRDFKNKIFICKKEANETKYWLRLLAKACPESVKECRLFWQETKELTLIFAKIIHSLEKND